MFKRPVLRDEKMNEQIDRGIALLGREGVQQVWHRRR